VPLLPVSAARTGPSYAKIVDYFNFKKAQYPFDAIRLDRSEPIRTTSFYVIFPSDIGEWLDCVR
jgi:hypothetical protein